MQSPRRLTFFLAAAIWVIFRLATSASAADEDVKSPSVRIYEQQIQSAAGNSAEHP